MLFRSHTFPLFCSVRCYAYHACLCHLLAFCASLHACAYMSIHEYCLLVCHPCFNTMKLWTPHFVCFLACLPYCLFACTLVSLLAMSIMLICFMPFRMLFTSFLSIACLLVSCYCLCMYTHGAGTHGTRALSPKRKQKEIGRASCRERV